jgi:drug/metabolite transporter (DMT)-like permease
MDSVPPVSAAQLTNKHATGWGVACGTASAFCWALGFVAARHGILAGVSPLVLALHRYVWAGFALIPVVVAEGIGDLGGVGWKRGFVITAFGGLPLALWAYFGYIYVPLGHGAIIQPSCAALGGLILAWLVVGEPVPVRRVAGALAMIAGLGVIGAEALHTMGKQGLFGDMLFVAAGSSFAIFGLLLRLWNIQAMRAVIITSVLSLAGLPVMLFSYQNMIAAGFRENVLQALVQGVFAGAGGIYLFTRAVILLGAGRASLFPALVPPFTLLIGSVTIGELPSLMQLTGLAIVLTGFVLSQKN